MANTALITGASSGIGRGIALALARRGYRLLLVGRDKPRLKAVAAEIPPELMNGIYSVDFFVPSDLSRLVDSVLTEHGVPSLLVNNAATMPAGDFVERSITEIEEAFCVNLLVPAVLTQRFCSTTTPPEGVIFVLSTAAQFPQPYNSLYSASKSGLRVLAESLQIEFGGKPRVCLAYPPVTATPMTARFESGRFPFHKADPLKVAEWIVVSYEAGQDEISWFDWEVIPKLFYRTAPRLMRSFMKSRRSALQQLFRPSKPDHPWKKR
jgi:short-subunit dehydrogenase